MSETVIELPTMDEVMRLVGNGIQAFGSAEMWANQCFQAMLGDSAPYGQLIMEGARHFEVRMRIADAVAPYAMSPELLPKWRYLSNRIRRKHGVRNKLAHWVAGYYPMPQSQPQPGDAAPQPVLQPPSMSLDWLALHRPELFANAKERKQVRPITVNELAGFVDDAIGLSIELSKLALAIQAERGGQKLTEIKPGQVGDDKPERA